MPKNAMERSSVIAKTNSGFLIHVNVAGLVNDGDQFGDFGLNAVSGYLVSDVEP